ncbi:hypothetical protein LINGRAHAP2_LOCUS8840 [Linum grandiflorum]
MIIPLSVLLVLATSRLSRVTSTFSDLLCQKPRYDNRAQCRPGNHWDSTSVQESIFRTFTYDVFEHGSGSFCVPFDIDIGRSETITVYSYFACNYGDNVDQDTCIWCMNKGITDMREECYGSTGATFRNEYCCLRYDTYDMCTDPS